VPSGYRVGGTWAATFGQAIKAPPTSRTRTRGGPD
jgi:hypothetical protein